MKKLILCLIALIAFPALSQQPLVFEEIDHTKIQSAGDSFRSALDLSRGKYPGVTVIHKFGRNAAIATTPVPIALGAVYQTPTTITALEIVSASADDNATGTGARSVFIQGISTDYEEASEVVVMNGLTAVPTVNSYYRVYRMYVVTSGTYATQAGGSAEGTIILRTAGAGATWVTMDNTANFASSQSQIAAYTVPVGFTCFVQHISIHVEGNKFSNIYFFKREDIDIVVAPFSPMRLVAEWNGLVGDIAHDIIIPHGPFPEKTDIGFMGSSTQVAEISVDFEIILVENR